MEYVYNNDAEIQRIALAEEQTRERFRQEDAGNMPSTTSVADRQYILDGFKTQRDRQKQTLKTQREQGFRNAWQGAYQSATSSDITAANRNLGVVGGRAGRQAAQSGSSSAIQAGRNTAKENKEGITSSESYQRGQRLNGK